MGNKCSNSQDVVESVTEMSSTNTVASVSLNHTEVDERMPGLIMVQPGPDSTEATTELNHVTTQTVQRESTTMSRPDSVKSITNKEDKENNNEPVEDKPEENIEPTQDEPDEESEEIVADEPSPPPTEEEPSEVALPEAVAEAEDKPTTEEEEKTSTKAEEPVQQVDEKDLTIIDIDLGDPEVEKAAVAIQGAFRKYKINKEKPEE